MAKHPYAKILPYSQLADILSPLVAMDAPQLNAPGEHDNFFKKLKRLKKSYSFPQALARDVYPSTGHVTIAALLRLAAHYHKEGRLEGKDFRRLAKFRMADPSKVKLVSSFGVYAGEYNENGWGQTEAYRPTLSASKNGIAHASADVFYKSQEWLKLRFEILARDGRKCASCGITPNEGAVMNVDHIKPRRKYPHLSLEPDNLQVLCSDCNAGKGNWDQTDFRKP